MSKKSRIANIFKQQLDAKNGIIGTTKIGPPGAPTINANGSIVVAEGPIQASGLAAVGGVATIGNGGTGVGATIDPGPAPKKQLINHVIVLLDDSGSMDNCYTTAVQQLENSLQKLKETAAAANQKTLVTMYLFSDRVARIKDQQPIEQLTTLDRSFRRGGRTMLIDATVEAIRYIRSRPVAKDTDTAYLVLCATDGGDNHTSYGPEFLKKLVQDIQATDLWTLAFMVPPGTKRRTERNGIPEGNIIEWENTKRGAEVAFAAVGHALDSYSAVRSAGFTSTKKFFVKTDLSALTKTEVTQKLQQLGNFKFATVEKEQAINEFAAEKTGKPYVTGSLFYALTKKETVQASKDVLLVEKGTKVVYGGPQARAMLGLPVGQEATVDPGNHSNWDVYVKSTSYNRILVRGTKVLIDTSKVVPDAETWDRLAAERAAEAKKAAAQSQTTT